MSWQATTSGDDPTHELRPSAWVQWTYCVLAVALFIVVALGGFPVPERLGQLSVGILILVFMFSVGTALLRRRSPLDHADRQIAEEIVSGGARSHWVGEIHGLTRQDLVLTGEVLSSVAPGFLVQRVSPEAGTMEVRTIPTMQSFGSTLLITCQDRDHGIYVSVKSEPALATTVIDYGESKRNVRRIVAILQALGRARGIHPSSSHSLEQQ